MSGLGKKLSAIFMDVALLPYSFVTTGLRDELDQSNFVKKDEFIGAMGAAAYIPAIMCSVSAGSIIPFVAMYAACTICVLSDKSTLGKNFSRTSKAFAKPNAPSV